MLPSELGCGIYIGHHALLLFFFFLSANFLQKMWRSTWRWFGGSVSTGWSVTKQASWLTRFLVLTSHTVQCMHHSLAFQESFWRHLRNCWWFTLYEECVEESWVSLCFDTYCTCCILFDWYLCKIICDEVFFCLTNIESFKKEKL